MTLVPGATTTAMLKTDGTLACSFSSAPSGTYFLTVRGSNMVQTWTASPVTVGATTLTYDFSTASNKAFEDNMVEVVTGVWAFYSGDVIDPASTNANQQDLNVDNADYSLWEFDANAGSYGVYPADLVAPADLNGDGNVDNADYSVWETNANLGIYSHTPPTP